MTLFYFLQIVHLDYTVFTVRKPVASLVKTKTVIKQTAPAQTVVEVDIQDVIAMKVRVKSHLTLRTFFSYISILHYGFGLLLSDYDYN